MVPMMIVVVVVVVVVVKVFRKLESLGRGTACRLTWSLAARGNSTARHKQ